MDKNRGIGKKNALPWYISEELKRFKRLTVGHVVVCGRNTFESIINRLKKPLPERTMIVITHDSKYKPPIADEYLDQVIVVNSIEKALEKAKQMEEEEIFIIGGAQIYEQAMKYIDRLYLTLVDKEYDVDTYFPDYSEFKKVVSEEPQESDGLKYVFFTLER